MNKRLAPLLSLLLALPWAAYAAPPTLAEQATTIDTVLYGEAQSGALLDRVQKASRDVYGAKLAQDGLAEQIGTLYNDVVRSDTTEPSLATRVNTLEWQLRNEISHAALAERIGALETEVYGEKKGGSLSARVLSLEKSIYKNRHFELREVEMPANTVFPITLSEGVATKTNQEGDAIRFTVAQDVFVDDVLVLPQGAQGTGVVTKIQPPRSFGRNGKLEVEFNQVFGIDDEPIATVLGPEAKEKLKYEAAALGASAAGAMVLGPIGLIGGYFVKGSDVDMPAGTALYIQVQDTVKTHGVVSMDGAPQTRKNDLVVTTENVAQPGETNAAAKERRREASKADAESAGATADEDLETITLPRETSAMTSAENATTAAGVAEDAAKEAEEAAAQAEKHASNAKVAKEVATDENSSDEAVKQAKEVASTSEKEAHEAQAKADAAAETAKVAKDAAKDAAKSAKGKVKAEKKQDAAEVTIEPIDEEDDDNLPVVIIRQE